MVKKPVNRMRTRILIIAVCISMLIPMVLIFRLFQLQIIDGEKYQKMAVEQQVTSSTITPERGAIYDTNMKTLAMSATVWSVILVPAHIKSDEEAADLAAKLSELLDVKEETILAKAEDKNSYYQMIKSKVEKDIADKVTEFVTEKGYSSIELRTDVRRYYPYGDLASSVLGFVNNDNNGAYGLEAYYNKVLSGTPGRVTSAKNGWGTDLNFRYQKLYEATNGNSLVLTIDEVVQHSLEKNLEIAVKEHGIQNRACGIVMDVNTGAILGMASEGDFNPNNPTEITDEYTLRKLAELEEEMERLEDELKKIPKSQVYAIEAAEQAYDEAETAYWEAYENAQFTQWSNKAISEAIEPGSVFKIVTAASALEAGTSKLEDSFTCIGYVEVAGWNISCWKENGHGTQNFTEALKHSCNPAFIAIGQRMGVHNFCTYFDDFGLTELTGIDLPGEASSIPHAEATMNISQLSSSAFGQTFKITPIQLVTAVCAAVNGGKLVQPHVVKQVLDADNNVVETTAVNVRRQVISEETSAKIRDMMEAVVGEGDGSGRSAAIPGYRIGGKTGTSEKIDQYNATGVMKYILSFVGVVPIDDPKYAVYVMLDEPLEAGYGSVIAAPVVQGVMNDILPYLGLDPSYTEKQLAEMEIKVPNATGLRTHDAASAMILAGLTPNIIGNGGTVLRQVPEMLEVMPRGGSVLLYTETEEDTTVAVPNVIGMTGQQANKTIVSAELNIRIEGEDLSSTSELVVYQDPAAGEQVESGTVVTIRFVETEPEDAE